MDKKTTKIKRNERLVGMKMNQKIKTSMMVLVMGIGAATVLGIIGITVLSSSMVKHGLSIVPGVIIGIVLALTLVFNVALSNIVAKALELGITEPIYQLKDAVDKIEKGDFNIEIEYESIDEIGELAVSLKNACAKMKEVVSDSGYMLSEMAGGKFNVKSNAAESYVGEFSNLLADINKLNGQLSDTLVQMQGASEEVRRGAVQLAESANELADGAQSQAGAIEELTATIESVTNISEESLEAAENAAADAKGAAEDAKKSREEINELTAAMDRITETSKEIENIIGAIEDIASQTNLLSLNASIEAARAGEAGRGFAVVADQIGKLATDSAQSAVTTRELISKSLEEIETGSRIVESAIKAIGGVLVSMEAFAEAASGAAEASKVQTDMLKQIEQGIEQITTVIQNNSATAQETSAVSEQLSSQSQNLESMISQFRI